MRIAIITPPWVAVPPPAYGGTEAVIDILARGLAAAGHDVLLFATGDSTCPVDRAWVVDEAVGLGAIATDVEIRQVLAARAHDVVRSADIIHDHTLVGPLVAAHAGDLPVVTTNHGLFDEQSAEYFAAIAGRVPVIAISERQAAASQTPIAAVIHHGIDTSRYKPGGGTGGYAAFVGRMSPDKGVAAACRIAQAAGIPLRIAAKMREPDERAYFEAFVRPLLGTDIEYLGELAPDDKVALLRDAVCLLNPIAWVEPFGMVMIEALACGTPVIVTPLGAAPEIVDHGVTGFVCDTEVDLVEALRAVHTLDRERCHHEASTRFSAERMVDEHISLFELVLARGREPERVG